MNHSNQLLIIGFIVACFVLQTTKINAQSLEREEDEIEKSQPINESLLEDNDSDDETETSVVIPNSIKPKPSDDDDDDEEDEGKDDPHAKHHRDRAWNRAMARIDRRKQRFEEKMKRKRARLERRRIRLERSATKYFELLDQQVEKAQNKTAGESAKKVWSKLRKMIAVLKKMMDKKHSDAAGNSSSSAIEKNLEEEVDKEISRFQTRLEELGVGKKDEPVLNQV